MSVLVGRAERALENILASTPADTDLPDPARLRLCAGFGLLNEYRCACLTARKCNSTQALIRHFGKAKYRDDLTRPPPGRPPWCLHSPEAPVAATLTCSLSHC